MALLLRQQGRVFAIAGLMCLMTGLANGQELDETGVIRITDSPSAAVQHGIRRTNCDRVASAAPGCLDGAQCGNGNGAGVGGQGYGCPQGVCQDACRNGGCPGGNCQHCGGCGMQKPCVLTWLGFCQPYGCNQCGNGCNTCCGKLSMSARRIMALIDPCSGACTHSPMHGFTPPSKRPYFRQPISYQHNFPAGWTGGTGSGYYGHRPAVYMPTDTTQLGYYYQKVPTWAPVPGRIPPAPQPGEWHYYGPTATAYAPCPTMAVEAGEPTEAQGTDEEAAPVPPMPEESVEKINLERSATVPNLIPITK